MDTAAQDVAARRRKLILGCAFGLALVVAAFVLVVQERATRDPFMPGTTHKVTLVRNRPCTDIWIATPDAEHEWQTDGAVPAEWTGDSIDGTLQVDAEWGPSTVVVGDTTVDVFGGRLASDRAIAVACGG